MATRPSIFEVARQSNCSIATVSNVLNNKGRVSKEKRKKILQVVAKLGYQVNSVGRNLRIRRTETFGLLFYPSCAEIFKNPFYAEVMQGLEAQLTRVGYHLLLAGYETSTTNSPIPNFLLSGKVDGMILLGRFPSEIIQVFHERKTPLLLLDANVEWPVDSIVSDGFSAGLQIVKHLADKGHRRIVMMAYEWEDYNIDLRIQGFLSGLQEQGLPGDEKSVIRHPGDDQSVTRQGTSHDAMYQSLKERLKGPNAPTALVAVNDTLAIDMVHRLLRDGIRVPEQLSVVGYDDDEMAQNLVPALTTIRVNKQELGRVGAELILKRATQPKTPVSKLRLPVELVERGSVADLRR
ncbi:MAG: LacI family transcriptional regulator [Verrucomicrobiales bacterium]|jgi:LacI family transcriptional regulator|nr:LacI family transcriptional regulator [Verrucomicrobiales bacterium]